MNILYLCLFPPLPLIDGGRIRTFHTLRQAGLRHQVTLACFTNSSSSEMDIDQLKSLCKAVHLVPFPSQDTSIKGKMRRFFSLKPYILDAWRSDQMGRILKSLSAQQSFDFVHIDNILLFQYQKCFLDTPCLLNHHNVENLIQKRLLEMTENVNFLSILQKKIDLWRLKHFEITSSRKSDVITVVSDLDAQFFSKYVRKDKIVLVPNGVDTKRLQPSKKINKNNALLFTGSMSYEPNIDAIIWFTRDIYPQLKSKFPGISFIIAGRDPTPEVTSLSSDPSITITGLVPDIEPYYRQSSIFVVPLRSGGGTRLKILEAMALGVPVISTALGAEGLDLVPGEDLLIADNESDFVKHISQLISNPELTKRLAKAGRKKVEKQYSWDRIGELQERAYQLSVQSQKVNSS